MIDKVKKGFNNIKEEHSKKKAEKIKIKLEKEAAEIKAEQERLTAEKEALEQEKRRLLELSDKDLMVELIIAVRGFYTKVSDIEQAQEQMGTTLFEIDDRLNSLACDVDVLENKLYYNED